MKSLTTTELRALFLRFFSERGHTIIPSASLIPENDPTVLFTTAGMHPLMPYLMGAAHPRYSIITHFAAELKSRFLKKAVIEKSLSQARETKLYFPGNKTYS